MEAEVEIINEVKKVPALRFPEFEKDWVKKRLKDEISFLPGFAFDSGSMKSSPSTYQLIKMSNVYQNELRLDRNPSYWDELSDKQQKFLLENGDTVLTLTGTVGKRDYGYSVMIKENNKFLLNQRLVRLREIKGKTDGEFITYLVSNEKFLYHFFSNSKGGTGNQSNVSVEDLYSLPLYLPSLLEQQKIASFLTAFDNKIQQLTKKKDLLEKYKNGVMQQIFSQRIRFKDENGQDFPEWEVKMLGQVFERVKRKNIENNKNVLTISAQQGLVNQEDYFNKSVSAENVTGYYLLHKGDFAYNKSYSKGYPMGAIKRLAKYDKGVVSTLYICFKIKDGSSEEFYEQYFNSGNLNSELHKIAQEGARNHGLLNMSVVEFFNDIKLPRPSEAEQLKIANFLSAIENKIVLVTEELEQAKLFKKGLLQQMFV